MQVVVFFRVIVVNTWFVVRPMSVNEGLPVSAFSWSELGGTKTEKEAELQSGFHRL